MLVHFETQDDLEDAMQTLVKQDPRLKPILALTGMPALRQREPGFAGLAHIVCGQQVSTASAAATPPSAITVWALPSSDLQINPTFTPAAEASMAARRPAPPAPITRTS